jgi:hypothetical protein
MRKEFWFLCRPFLNQVWRKDFTRKQRGRPLDFFVDQFKTKCEERTSQDNQRGRPHDIVVDHFITKREVRTSQENKEEVLLISLSTRSKPSVKKGHYMIIKEVGLLISLSTSSKPSMKRGLHKHFKEEPSWVLSRQVVNELLRKDCTR